MRTPSRSRAPLTPNPLPKGQGRRGQIQELHHRRRLGSRQAADVRHRQQAHPRFDCGAAAREYPQDAARRRRRLHRPGAGQRLCRPRQQGHRRRVDGQPFARRRCRSGAAAPRRLARASSTKSISTPRSPRSRKSRTASRRSSREKPTSRKSSYEKILVAVGRRPEHRQHRAGQDRRRGRSAASSRPTAQRRTNMPNIFAIGDAAGEPMLAHKASHEGKLAVEVISAAKRRPVGPARHPGRRLHRSGNRLVRADRNRRQEAKSRGQDRPFPLGLLGPGDHAGPQ